MYMIEIEESKVEKMSSLVEDMLTIGGRLMNCLEGLSSEREYDTKSSRNQESERRDYDERYSRRNSRY